MVAPSESYRQRAMILLLQLPQSTLLRLYQLQAIPQLLTLVLLQPLHIKEVLQLSKAVLQHSVYLKILLKQ